MEKIDQTDAYYEREAEEYARFSRDIDLTPLYAPFLGLIPAGGSILDAGCGAGRDSQYFVQHGYKVSAFDASRALADIASQNTGLVVRCLRFQELEDKDLYHGIWACASLLHVPEKELVDVLRRLSRALKAEGTLYMSFRYGRGETMRGERFFLDCDEESLKTILQPLEELEIVYVWKSADLARSRPDVFWLNALVEKIRPQAANPAARGT